MTAILMISRDAKAADRESAVYKRMRDYSRLFDELHVVVMARGKKAKKIDQGNLHIYPVFSRIGFLSFLGSLTRCFEVAQKIGKKNSFITAQDPFEAGLAGLIVKKVFGLPLQIQIHTDLFSPAYKKAGLKERKNRFLAGLTLTEADRLRVVSQKIAEEAKTYLAKSRIEIPIITMSVFVDFKKMEQMKSRGKRQSFGSLKTILVVSRLEKEKNIALAIESFATFRKTGGGAALVIAGEGSEKKYLEQLSHKLEMGEFVHFVGFQPDLSDFYASADALLSTSLYEGFGMALLEGAYFGIPIVSTDVGIARELGAYIANPDPQEISVLLKQAVSDEKHIYDLSAFHMSESENNTRFKESFS